jgi:hypothetical protein
MNRHNANANVFANANKSSIKSSIDKRTKQRRTFIKRATASAVIASIPGRSAWAAMSGSIVASGHGSDFNQGSRTMLFDSCQLAAVVTGRYHDHFGSNQPINGHGNPYAKDILEGNDPDPNDVNAAMLIMLYNAINHGATGIYYPVLSQYNNNSAEFATYLYANATDDPSGVANLLWNTIGEYSSSGRTTTCPQP